MLKWFRESIKVGNATIKYPFAPLEQSPDTRGKPEHDSKACLACGACATVCPANAIQMEIDTKNEAVKWSINYGRCIFCGRCEEVCPAKAIQLTLEFELAVMDKNDLLETSSYKLEHCQVCGKPFAPRKEVEYLERLLKSQNLSSQAAASALANIRTCQVCKQVAESANVMQITSNFERGL